MRNFYFEILVSFSLIRFNLVKTTEKFWFWKSLKYFLNINDMTSGFKMSNEKISDFVSFLLIGYPFVLKLRNFRFESYWNTLIFFDKETDYVRFEYILCLTSFKLFCVTKSLAISWVIRTLDFIEIAEYFSIKKSVVRSKFVQVFYFLFVFFGITKEIISN